MQQLPETHVCQWMPLCDGWSPTAITPDNPDAVLEYLATASPAIVTAQSLLDALRSEFGPQAGDMAQWVRQHVVAEARHAGVTYFALRVPVPPHSEITDGPPIEAVIPSVVYVGESRPDPNSWVHPMDRDPWL